MTLSKSPNRRKSETVISGHRCCYAGVAAFTDRYLETARSCAFGQKQPSGEMDRLTASTGCGRSGAAVERLP